MEDKNNNIAPLNMKALLVTCAVLVLLPVLYVSLRSHKSAEEIPAAPSPIIGDVKPAPVTPQGQVVNLSDESKAEEKRLSDLGLAYYSNKQFKESIDAYKQVVTINPANALAYNNMCSAYNNLSMWNEAIEAGENAVRIDPSFQLAKNNLNWAKQMKAQGK